MLGKVLAWKSPLGSEELVRVQLRDDGDDGGWAASPAARIFVSAYDLCGTCHNDNPRYFVSPYGTRKRPAEQTKVTHGDASGDPRTYAQADQPNGRLRHRLASSERGRVMSRGGDGRLRSRTLQPHDSSEGEGESGEGAASEKRTI